ncbi:MAG: cell division protein SepF [Actinomycetota bacterium]|nr:cell division protein SepF [Actinomycetota bacterium]
MGLWHNIKVRLGLEDDWDDEYYEDDEFADGNAADDSESADGFYGRSVSEAPQGTGFGTRRANREPDIERAWSEARSRDRERLRSVPSGSGVAQMTPQVKMHIIEPRSFTEAQNIADKFKQGTPVIVNMTMTSPDLAKRFIDFSSGLTYGLDGGIQKVSDKVFMLTPTNVDVSAGDMRRLRDKGLFPLE